MATKSVILDRNSRLIALPPFWNTALNFHIFSTSQNGYKMNIKDTRKLIIGVGGLSILVETRNRSYFYVFIPSIRHIIPLSWKHLFGLCNVGGPPSYHAASAITQKTIITRM